MLEEIARLKTERHNLADVRIAIERVSTDERCGIAVGEVTGIRFVTIDKLLDALEIESRRKMNRINRLYWANRCGQEIHIIEEVEE